MPTEEELEQRITEHLDEQRTLESIGDIIKREMEKTKAVNGE